MAEPVGDGDYTLTNYTPAGTLGMSGGEGFGVVYANNPTITPYGGESGGGGGGGQQAAVSGPVSATFSAVSLSGLVPGTHRPAPQPPGLCGALNYDARRVFCNTTRVVVVDSATKRRVTLGRQTWIQFYATNVITVMRNQRFYCEVPATRGIVHTFWSDTSEGDEWELFLDWNSTTVVADMSNNNDWMMDSEAYVRAVGWVPDPIGAPTQYIPTTTQALVGPLFVRFTASQTAGSSATNQFLPAKQAGVTTAERRPIIT